MAERAPQDSDNVISMKAARERAAREKAARPSGPPNPKPRLPVFLIFLGLLAVVVAVKFLTGG